MRSKFTTFFSSIRPPGSNLRFRQRWGGVWVHGRRRFSAAAPSAFGSASDVLKLQVSYVETPSFKCGNTKFQVRKHRVSSVETLLTHGRGVGRRPKRRGGEPSVHSRPPLLHSAHCARKWHKKRKKEWCKQEFFRTFARVCIHHRAFPPASCSASSLVFPPRHPPSLL